MMATYRIALISLIWSVATSSASSHPPSGRRPSIAQIANSPATRLLVVAPHPDDEVLAAGGLIHHVVSIGGQVRVVYLTDGDGFPEGVAAEEHSQAPKPGDYRE